MSTPANARAILHSFLLREISPPKIDPMRNPGLDKSMWDLAQKISHNSSHVGNRPLKHFQIHTFDAYRICLRTKAISYTSKGRALAAVTLRRMCANNVAIFSQLAKLFFYNNKKHIGFGIHFSTAAFLHISQQQGCSSIRLLSEENHKVAHTQEKEYLASSVKWNCEDLQ